MSVIDRAYGALVGLMVGDAFGSQARAIPVEELARRFPDGILEMDTIERPVGSGTVADATEMTLMLATSLVDKGGFDIDDIRYRYKKWFFSDLSVERARDITSALRHDYILNLVESNGALMRIAPLGIYGTRISEEELLNIVAKECLLTHRSWACEHANQLWVLALRKAILEESSNEEIYNHMLELANSLNVNSYVMTPLERAYTVATSGDDYQEWVVVAFQQALYTLLHATSIEDGIRTITMRGGDTGTNAAIYGMMAGAIHGSEAIPRRWIEALKPSTSLFNLRLRFEMMPHVNRGDNLRDLLESRIERLDTLAYDLAAGLLG